MVGFGWVVGLGLVGWIVGYVVGFGWVGKWV